MKPLEYYAERHETPLWGLNKLYLMMEKQHNRGQDGFGIGCVKFDMPMGKPFIFRERSVESGPLERIFRKLTATYAEQVAGGLIDPNDAASHKMYFPFAAELYLGHLRYGTHGDYSIATTHPVLRESNWASRNLLLAGNFNLTNTPDLIQRLIDFGQHPTMVSDTQTVLEKIGHFLDEQNSELYREIRDSILSGQEIAREISERLDLVKILRNSCRKWDGGYVIAGLTGNGDAFVMRDANGIRPCWYLKNDEVLAVASERAAIMTAFDADAEAIDELLPGSAIVVKKCGHFAIETVRKKGAVTQCSFERIYFSRGTDRDIYRERKALGRELLPQILKAIGNDIEKTVFGFIPNSAEVAYMGLFEALREHRRNEVKTEILMAQKENRLDRKFLDDVMSVWPRTEKVAVKDAKLRTFISQARGRKDLVSHVYDVTYGICAPDDCLVCLDDSIVRGTTLRESILRILARLNPRKIVIVSSAPQIRYPDCYGIDMSELGKFVAFEAAIELLNERGQQKIIDDVYKKCKKQQTRAGARLKNHVKEIYAPFEYDEISAKVTELVSPRNLEWRGEFEIVYQTIDGLRRALPDHRGDWYFTGDYPTDGGFRVVNTAFINYYENNEGRSY